MKILFIDTHSIQNTIRIGLLEDMGHHEVCLIDNTIDAMRYYKKEHPDMVLIDFTTDFGHESLERILEENPSQHIITISDSLDCTELIGCDHCLEHYRKRRLLKKQSIHDLLYLISNFSEMPCEFAHKLDHPLLKDEEEDKEE